MVLLGGPEGARSGHLGGQRLAELGCRRRLRFLRLGELLAVDRIDRSRIGVAAVAELAAAIRRIDGMPEDVEQRRVADPGRVEFDAHGLAMALMVAIAGVLERTARVAGGGRDDARDGVEVAFHAPEASSGEDRRLGPRGVGGRRSKSEKECGDDEAQAHFKTSEMSHR